MRLLKYGTRGEISLTGDLVDNVPAYAILSHTWGADGEEVTFDDLERRRGKSKVGREKNPVLWRTSTAARSTIFLGGHMLHQQSQPRRALGSHHLDVSLVSRCREVLCIPVRCFGRDS